MPSFCGLMSCWHMEPRTASTIMWPQKITCDHQHSETGSFEAEEQPRVLKTCGISKLMDSEAANFWTFLMPTQHLRLGVLILSLMCTKPRPWASPQTCFLNSVLHQFTSPLSWSALKPWVSLEFFLSLISHTNIQQTLWALPLKYHQKSLLTTSTTTTLVKQLDSPSVTWIMAEATEPGSMLPPFPWTPYAPRGSQSGPFKT